MAQVKINAMAGTFLVLMLATNASAKAWRSITPLKSTRADVERLLGKPNDLGRYEIENDRAYIFYSEGQCSQDYQNLAQGKCECLVAKDTVLRITVTLENAIEIPIDKRRFTKTALRSNTPISAYSDLNEGIVYTVRDSDETVTAIDYWPSSTDCKAIIGVRSASIQRNVWRGIRPMQSTRDDVERILGPSKQRSLNGEYAYQTKEEQIDILYSEGPCSPSVVGKWNVPLETVLRITIHPQKTVLIRDLELDKNKYRRGPDPNIPNWFFWVNREEGIIIQSQLKDGCEQVMSIEYSRSDEDQGLLCK